MASLRTILHWTLLLHLLVFVNLSYSAADFDREVKPGALQVQVDRALLNYRPEQKPEDGDKSKGKKKAPPEKRRIVFSTRLRFKEAVTAITDAQLRKMLEDAYKEMQAAMKIYSTSGPRRMRSTKGDWFVTDNQPLAMSILAVGNEVFFASSQSGGTSFINVYADSPVRQALELCQQRYGVLNEEGEAGDHKFKRHCGEIMILHQYYQRHTEKIGSLSPQPRITTIGEVGPDAYEMKAPCGDELDDDEPRGKWGCRQLIQEDVGRAKYLEDLPSNADYDLASLAGGVEEIDQVTMCGPAAK